MYFTTANNNNFFEGFDILIFPKYGNRWQNIFKREILHLKNEFRKIYISMKILLQMFF